ncbi:hypothetical protein HMPREF2140_10815 [Hoylesella buccalis DNF00985]|nr:hypothetical protein HMPREF2140_10815 [Hoylesella buccalis DNF00985]
MRVFGMVVKIFRMPNTMFSSVEFSVSIRSVFYFHPFDFLFASVLFSAFISCLMLFAFCNSNFFVFDDMADGLCEAGNRHSLLPQLPFLLMDDNALS